MTTDTNGSALKAAILWAAGAVGDLPRGENRTDLLRLQIADHGPDHLNAEMRFEPTWVGPRLTVTGTDAYQIRWASVRLAGEVAEADVLVDPKALLTLVKTWRDSRTKPLGDVAMEVGAASMSLEVNGVATAFGVQYGKFPGVDRVVGDYATSPDGIFLGNPTILKSIFVAAGTDNVSVVVARNGDQFGTPRMHVRVKPSETLLRSAVAAGIGAP